MNRYSRFHVRPGWIEVIVGCMFSGKTEELLTEVRRAKIARQKFQLFKPSIDSRYSKTDVSSHNQNSLPSTVVKTPLEILENLKDDTLVIAIDEVQFFDESIVNVVSAMADKGKRVILAGLDTDWRGRPFGPVPKLMAIAEVVKKQYAICMVCGEPATRTQRLVAANEDILLGSTEAYEARCRPHFDPELTTSLQKPKKSAESSLSS